QVFISPNGKRYALLVVRTDIARNGNWLEVLTGSLTSLSAVARVRTAARLFTDSFGSQTGYGASALTLPNFNTVGWLDDSELAFLWEGGQQKANGIMSDDLDMGVVRRRTDEGMDVTRFDVVPNGVLIYAMAIPQLNPESSECIRQEG